jgi:hypothetical protein
MARFVLYSAERREMATIHPMANIAVKAARRAGPHHQSSYGQSGRLDRAPQKA